jgi:ubiquitin-like-conjugating enzyme ATG3
MQSLRSALNTIRDTYYPVNRTSNFRETGEITPEEFLIAGDYLVYKFPSWSWSGASSASKRVTYLPEDKQFLVTRGVPCHQRLGDQAGNDIAELNDVLVNIAGEDGDEEWLSTGGLPKSSEDKASEDRSKEVKSVDDNGKLTDAIADEDEIPDMEDDDDDDAIIRDTKPKDGGSK